MAGLIVKVLTGVAKGLVGWSSSWLRLVGLNWLKLVGLGWLGLVRRLVVETSW